MCGCWPVGLTLCKGRTNAAQAMCWLCTSPLLSLLTSPCSHCTCARQLIEGVLARGVNLAEAYIDALGDTTKHKARAGS